MEAATLKLKSFSKKCALLYPNKYSDTILEPTEKEKKNNKNKQKKQNKTKITKSQKL